MPPRAKTTPAAETAALLGDEATARYEAALIEGKTENEARAIAWPDGAPDAEPEPFDPIHCPTPQTCFPYGLSADTSHAACIHGETQR